MAGAFIFAVLFSLVSGCRAPAEPEGTAFQKPGILLVTLDTVRADHCSAYGYHRPTTPTLERLAAEGALFENAYAPMATTGPSHATMFTSRQPLEHGFVKNGLTLDDGYLTLAEAFREAGYDTAAFVSSFAVHGKFGFRQGFDLYDDRFDEDGAPPTRRTWEGHLVEGSFDRDGLATARRAASWLRGRNTAAPFLLWVHLFDPHSPYDPPAPYDRLFVDEVAADDELALVVARYDAEIREADAALALILEAADGLDGPPPLVVVVGDHGEGLMDHGWMEHGLQLYEEAVRAPWIVRWTGMIPPGTRLVGPVILADLFPTLLDLTGIPPPPGERHGLSLATVLRGGGELDPERDVFLQRRFYEVEAIQGRRVRGDKFAVRKGRWKYIEAVEEGTFELYDLSRDTGEEVNLHAEFPREARDLSERIAAWRSAVGGGGPPAVETISPEDAERLRTLGYVR